ncbi:EAL domain-containing protein [Aliiglaciecola sp. LCG003]|uniref:EAL domain-containing protein n=1 Tax=Aliiglaciecola sp. LCG003 TaxID=3053655 RepID=UPI002572279E|nr:EAL domain-containing protein [Aliiglaciecola sp. LCG003]WJG10634.1 EAL domain-containing protein [Aliiglaciecola sp. LCG003]
MIVQTALLSLSAKANIADIQLRNFSVEQGLSQSSVTDIIEDKNGYIWVATMEGLNRFDGTNFKLYTPKLPNGNNLPIEYIRKLYIDSNDVLWISAVGGVARYLPESDEFKVYSPENSQLKSRKNWAIAEIKPGRLIVSGEKKLYEYNPQTDDFAAITFSNDIQLDDTVRTMFVEKDKIWLGTENSGPYAIDIDSNALYPLFKENPWGLFLENPLYDLKVIDDQYWLATTAGVVVLSSDYKTVMTLTSTRDDKLKIINNYVRSIIEEKSGKVWLSTADGISIYDKAEQAVSSIDEEYGIFVGLTNYFIITAYQDSKGSIWFGTHTSGMFKYHPQFSSIKHFQTINGKGFSSTDNSVWAFADYTGNSVWVTTLTGGLSLYSENGTFKRYLNNANLMIWDIAIDAKMRLWLATDKGVKVYSYTNEKLSLLKTYFDGMPIVELTKVHDNYWIKAIDEKLFSIDSLRLDVPPQEVSYANLEGETPLLSDSKGNIWLKTDIGLVIQDAKYNTFKQLTLRTSINDIEPVVFNVHETNDFFWVSTGKHGLFKLDKDSYQVLENFHPRGFDVRGLVVNSVLDTKEQTTVWQSSQSEIWQISLLTGKLLKTIPRHLLDYNDLNEGAVFMSRTGLVFFGGINGFHIFNSEKLIQTESGLISDIADHQQKLAPPKITQLRIHNKPVKVGEANSPLSQPLIMTKKISLTYESIPFTLEFGHINSLFKGQLLYRYRLLGWRDTWLETNLGEQFAAFSIETYGEHTFEVQGRVGDGPWSDSAQLDIVISPPYWLDKPALALYGIFTVIILLYILRQYKRRLSIQNAIRESEERLKLTLWSSGDELWDWDVFRGQVYRANTWGTIDFPQDNIRANSSYQANIHPNDMLRVQKALNEHIAKNSEHFQVSYRAKTFKGEWIWILDRGMIVKRDNNNQPLRMTGTLKNISHLKQAEEQLKLYERSIETISDGVFIADTNFRFISVNQSYCQYTGETREQALASFFKFNQYPEAFTEEVKKALRQKGNWNGEVESRRVNGDRYEMELNVDAIHGEDGRTTHYVGVFSDITSRKSTEKELLKLANTDPLTEMPNRSFFQASHNNLVRKDVAHALVCLDMDNFKKINDSLGHQTGDILIKQIGKRLQKIAGTNATCYRLGGDEFSILIDNEDEMLRINHYAQRILDQMAHPFIINKQEFVLSASVGIAFYPEDGNNPQELLKNADTAMYFAKNSGGNKYQFFSGEMNQNAVRQLQIENLIRYGLKEDLFTVHYQPKVDISSGKLVSMEALVRFEHPEKGIVSPAQFIPLAEETGQIIEIGERVLRKACEDTKRWVAKGLFTGRVAVNISARQFELPDLDDRINRILQKVGLSPLHLECEITEGTLMQNPDQALQLMDRLREKGIHLALDDFGTGYSSLAYLKKFPLNTLKIDKAFIDDIATSSVDRHMTAAIINIAHNLGLKVVAEGVEQERQLEILKRYECEMLQGYLYSKPLSASKFEKLLNENLHISQLLHKSKV